MAVKKKDTKGLRKPSKGEVVLHHRAKNIFKVVNSKFLAGYPAHKTVQDDDPNNYDGYYAISYEDAEKVLATKATPPEAK